VRHEKRFTSRHKVTTEKRSEDQAGGKVIRGYAAVFFNEADPAGTQYNLWDDIVERVKPGAFDRAISEAHDARGLFNHDANWLLGRVSSGTVRLSVDSVGLHYEIDVNEDDPQWQSIAAKIDRGDITGSSFGFVVRKATWTEQADGEKKIWYRSIDDVDLFDVSPVTWPAYTGTSAGRGASPDDRAELLAERNRQGLDAQWAQAQARANLALAGV
jgi:uncharacterized protein